MIFFSIFNFLIRKLDKIYSALNKVVQKYTLGIILDLKKAFETEKYTPEENFTYLTKYYMHKIRFNARYRRNKSKIQLRLQQQKLFSFCLMQYRRTFLIYHFVYLTLVMMAGLQTLVLLWWGSKCPPHFYL